MKEKIITLTDKGLEVCEKPFEQLAIKIHSTEKEIINNLNEMLKDGTIRRIAGVPNHYQMGYKYNGMTVWDIEDSMVDQLGQIVGQLDFVSHCYKRPRHPEIWSFNLFAMVHGTDQNECENKRDIISNIVINHCRSHDILYSTKILKKTGFRSKK